MALSRDNQDQVIKTVFPTRELFDSYSMQMREFMAIMIFPTVQSYRSLFAIARERPELKDQPGIKDVLKNMVGKKLPENELIKEYFEEWRDYDAAEANKLYDID